MIDPQTTYGHTEIASLAMQEAADDLDDLRSWVHFNPSFDMDIKLLAEKLRKEAQR